MKKHLQNSKTNHVNLSSCTLNVILFSEQGMEIRAFPPSQTLIIWLVNKIFGNAPKTD